MKLWMNSCASRIGSPTGTPRRMRSLVFMVVGSVENGGRGVRAHSECAVMFVLFIESELLMEKVEKSAAFPLTLYAAHRTQCADPTV